MPTAVDLSPFDDLFTPAAPNRFRVVFRPRPDLYAKGIDTTLLMRELSLLGTLEVACDASNLPGLAEMDSGGAYLAWTATLDPATNPCESRSRRLTARLR